MSAPGTGGQGAAVSLGPEVQDRHAFGPDPLLSVEHAPCPTRPLLSPLQPGFCLSAQGAGDNCIAGSPASQSFPDQKANGSCSPRLACCTFHRHAPEDRTEKRIPFLKALSTGATTLLSQAEGMPRHRGFRSMRVYYTVLRRPAQATVASLRPDSDFRKIAVLSQRGCLGKEPFAV